MSPEEKSAVIGYYRNGMSYEIIAYIMGISESYARLIVENYLKDKK